MTGRWTAALVGVVVAAGWSTGCSPRGEATPAATSATGAAPPPTATASVAATASDVPSGDAEPDDDFREAMRRLDYRRAYDRLQALDEATGARPEIRLARGRAALGAGEAGEAVASLMGLEAQLPLVADLIRRLRAEAALIAGPHLEAARYFEASPKTADLLRAATAYRRHEDSKRARALLDRAIRQAERTRQGRDLAAAHRARASLAEAMGDAAIALGDHRWLAVERNDREAMAAYLRLGGTLPAAMRAGILQRSTTKANLDATLDALDRLGTADREVAFHRARALYRARDYDRAAPAFDAFLARAHPLAAEAAYYAARTAARRGETKAALDRYRALAKAHPKTTWSERATFRYAELMALAGRHEAAVKGFSRYLSRHEKAKAAPDARFQRAVALLSAGKHERARDAFRGYAARADGWRDVSHAQHLEALASLRAGDRVAAQARWHEIIRAHPLTYPALAARARLGDAGLDVPPPLTAPAPSGGASPPLPLAIALLHRLGMDAEAERILEAAEADVVAAYPGRESEVLCALYGQLAGARRRAQIANRAVSLELLMRAPKPTERWAWHCIYPRPFATVVPPAERTHAVPQDLVYAIMRQESFFRTTVTSPVGARGLMQLMPYTAARAASEAGLPFDPEQVTRPDVNV
ncbi:MAG: transglycosylase SLT domain-containing protein, partial [Myxococcota bacterium]